MKILSVKAGLLPSIIHIPTSKSYANRALILAALKIESFTIQHLPQASDVTFLVKALKQVGLTIEQNNDELTVTDSFPACEKPGGCTIEIGEGGTTARFLASLLVQGKEPYTLILGERLQDRPWNELIKLIKNLGGKARLHGNSLSIQGPIQIPDKIEVDCSETTQYASGLQLALAFSPCEIIPQNLNSSESYWEMTKAMIATFKTSNSFVVPTDWSSASYPLAFGVLKQNIFFPGLKYDPFQADAKFLNILKQLGLIQETPEGIKTKPGSVVKDFKMDVSDCLDLVPALAFLLSHIEGTHHLRGVKNLVHKESDRLKEIVKLLEEFGFKASSDGSVLQIEGSSTLRSIPVDLNLPDDHRIVMIGALFLRYHQGGTISPAMAVNKSYPNFFKLLGV
ncbi:MAG: hypothetical protein H0V66_09775 [Bdellovibrionales bacterium]|nr:hypothetical protein [Bdellovibrionales bacterium]